VSLLSGSVSDPESLEFDVTREQEKKKMAKLIREEKVLFFMDEL
jgi:hypothetical protein